MIVVKPKKTCIETQIEIDFDKPKEGEKEKKRSVVGSLHFRPGVAKSITLDEFEFIKIKHSGFFKELIVLFEKSDEEEKKEEKKVEVKEEKDFEIKEPDLKTTKIKKKADTIEEEKK